MAVGATVKNFIFPFLRELKLIYVHMWTRNNQNKQNRNRLTVKKLVVIREGGQDYRISHQYIRDRE